MICQSHKGEGILHFRVPFVCFYFELENKGQLGLCVRVCADFFSSFRTFMGVFDFSEIFIDFISLWQIFCKTCLITKQEF